MDGPCWAWGGERGSRCPDLSMSWERRVWQREGSQTFHLSPSTATCVAGLASLTWSPSFHPVLSPPPTLPLHSPHSSYSDPSSLSLAQQPPMDGLPVPVSQLSFLLSASPPTQSGSCPEASYLQLPQPGAALSWIPTPTQASLGALFKVTFCQRSAFLDHLNEQSNTATLGIPHPVWLCFSPWPLSPSDMLCISLFTVLGVSRLLAVSDRREGDRCGAVWANAGGVQGAGEPGQGGEKGWEGCSGADGLSGDCKFYEGKTHITTVSRCTCLTDSRH